MSHVRVALRMKPATEAGTSSYVTVVSPGTMMLNRPGEDDMFSFNFSHAMTCVDNEKLHEVVGKPIVESVLEGYNATLLAYGQTGSGKTYSILGPELRISEMSIKDRGIMPRALGQLFSALSSTNKYSTWKMQVTYCEVYCEVLRDLLSEQQPARLAGAGHNKKGQTGIDVMEANGVMKLKGVTPIEVKSMEEVEALIERAQKIRAQASTAMNDRSSRSHTILTIWLQTSNSTGAFNAKLNIVDLAGSERRKAIGNQGAQTNKEGDAINKSLLTLQTVVMALGSKGVPAFRESKLTHFLKDSIGGNCKTTLLACAWGDPSKMQETLATCRFAEKMMKVVVNAKKNAGGGLQGGYGNKVKLDPIVLALMEKRVAEQVEIERKKLLNQFQQSSGGDCEGDAMTAEQMRELEALRKRVEELDSRSKALDAGVERLPSEVELEMVRLRQEVEKSRLKEIELEEARLAAEQRLQTSADQPVPEVPTLDDSVGAFMKLRNLQPQQQELQRRLDENGGLNDEDAECLDFINDEIARLLDILQKHGFHFPELGIGSLNGQALGAQAAGHPLCMDTSESEDDVDIGLSPTIGGRSRQQANTIPAQHITLSGEAGTCAATALPDQSGWIGSGAMHDPSALPQNLARPTNPGLLSKLRSSFAAKSKQGSPGNTTARDALTAPNRLQGGQKGQHNNEMVFLSPLGHSNITAVLDDHSAVDATVPLTLESMPKMPKPDCA